MTNEEAYTMFNVNYDAIASLQAPPLETLEINSLMNQSMLKLVAMLNRQKMYDQLIEITVVEKLSLTACTIEEFGTYSYQETKGLPTDLFLYYVNSHLKMTRTTPVTNTMNPEWVKCVEIQRPEVDYFVTTSFHKPIIMYPKVLIHFNSTFAVPIVITDCYSTIYPTDGFEFIYIRKPNAIDLTLDSANFSELNEDLQHLIVMEAINIAIKATDEDRLKLNLQELRQKQPQQN